MELNRPDRLLSAVDLADRWGTTPEHAWEVAKDGVPGVWLGRGDYSPRKRGPKTVRFRLEAVRAFEARREVALAANQGGPAAAVVPPPAAAVPGWDGKARGRNRKA